MANPTQTETKLGAAIRDARVRAHLNQTELGEFAGVDRFTIANLERGQFTTQVRRLLAVLDAVGLELSVTSRSRRLASAAEPEAADAEAADAVATP